MPSDNQKLKIREVINLTNYKLNIRKDFINFLESTYGSQKHRLYLFSRIESTPKIFLLHHTGSTVSFPLRFPNGIAIPLHIMLSVGSATSTQNLRTWADVNAWCLEPPTCYTFIYKVSDKLRDFENDELYDMIWRFPPWTHCKRAVWVALTAKKQLAVFIIVSIIMYRVIAKKERRSELIAEISDAIKKKFINVSFDFILK